MIKKKYFIVGMLLTALIIISSISISKLKKDKDSRIVSLYPEIKLLTLEESKLFWKPKELRYLLFEGHPSSEIFNNKKILEKQVLKFSSGLKSFDKILNKESQKSGTDFSNEIIKQYMGLSFRSKVFEEFFITLSRKLGKQLDSEFKIYMDSPFYSSDEILKIITSGTYPSLKFINEIKNYKAVNIGIIPNESTSLTIKNLSKDTEKKILGRAVCLDFELRVKNIVEVYSLNQIKEKKVINTSVEGYSLLGEEGISECDLLGDLNSSYLKNHFKTLYDSKVRKFSVGIKYARGQIKEKELSQKDLNLFRYQILKDIGEDFYYLGNYLSSYGIPYSLVAKLDLVKPSRDILGNECIELGERCNYSFTELIFSSSTISPRNERRVLIDAIVKQFSIEEDEGGINRAFLEGGRFKTKDIVKNLKDFKKFPVVLALASFGRVNEIIKHSSKLAFPQNSRLIQRHFFKELFSFNDYYPEEVKSTKNVSNFLLSGTFKPSGLALSDILVDNYDWRKWNKRERSKSFSFEEWNNILETFLKLDVDLRPIFLNDSCNNFVFMEYLIKFGHYDLFEEMVKRNYKLSYVIPPCSQSLKPLINKKVEKILRENEKWPIVFDKVYKPMFLDGVRAFHEGVRGINQMNYQVFQIDKNSSAWILYETSKGVYRRYSSKKLDYEFLPSDFSKFRNYYDGFAIHPKWDGKVWSKPNSEFKVIKNLSGNSTNMHFQFIEARIVDGIVWLKVKFEKRYCDERDVWDFEEKQEGWIKYMDSDGVLRLTSFGMC